MICSICGRKLGQAFPVHCACGTTYTSLKEAPKHSTVEKLGSYRRATKRWINAGSPTRSKESIEELYSICEQCPLFDSNTCNACGCTVSQGHTALLNKIAMGTEGCPQRHWGPRWVTSAELLQAADAIAGALPRVVDAVIGIPRSGLLPAAQIATNLELPLWTLSSRYELIKVGVGHRGRSSKTPRVPVIVDDTIASGRQFRKVLRALKPHLSAYIKSACFVTPKQESLVDIYGSLLELPHYLEWNFMNSIYTKHSAFDLDGILCKNFYGKNFESWAETAQPLYRPRSNKILGIITARPEALRSLTEAWLERVGIRYSVLKMWPSAPELRTAKNVAAWKAQQTIQLGADQYIESEDNLAKLIQQAVPSLRVICPPSGRVYG